MTDDTILKITDTLSYRSNPSEDFKPVKVDITGLATENWVEDKHYLTEHQSLEEYLKSSKAEETYQPKGEYLTEETDPTVPAWAKEENKPIYTAEEVGALPDTTIIPEVPEDISAFNNDIGYITEHQDISGKYDKSGGEISGNVKIDGWLQMKIEDEDYNAGIQFTPRLDDNLGTVLTLTGYAHG